MFQLKSGYDFWFRKFAIQTQQVENKPYQLLFMHVMMDQSNSALSLYLQQFYIMTSYYNVRLIVDCILGMVLLCQSYATIECHAH